MYNCQIGLHWRNNYSKKKRMKIWLFYLASIWKTIYGLVWFSLVIKSLFITSLMTSIFIQHTTSGVNYAIILRMVALICSVRLSLPRRWKIHSRQRDYHHSEYSAPLPHGLIGLKRTSRVSAVEGSKDYHDFQGSGCNHCSALEDLEIVVLHIIWDKKFGIKETEKFADQ